MTYMIGPGIHSPSGQRGAPADLALISSTKLRLQGLPIYVSVRLHPKTLAFSVSGCRSGAGAENDPHRPEVDPRKRRPPVGAGPWFFMAYKWSGPLANDAYRVAPPVICERRLCTGAMSAALAPKATALSAFLVMGYFEGAAV